MGNGTYVIVDHRTMVGLHSIQRIANAQKKDILRQDAVFEFVYCRQPTPLIEFVVDGFAIFFDSISRASRRCGDLACPEDLATRSITRWRRTSDPVVAKSDGAASKGTG